MSYTIEQHTHVSATWDAATGARASKLCRFPVVTGREILEAAGFTADFNVNDLPQPTALDEKHTHWRDKVVGLAGGKGFNFSHGIAAKLINGYLKARFVCGGYHEHERVRCLHPPIDRLLLNALAEANFCGHEKQWRAFHDQGWSKFDSATYRAVIDLMRQSLPAHEPFWKIEEYWRGYQ